jgi:hypothetical protein
MYELKIIRVWLIVFSINVCMYVCMYEMKIIRILLIVFSINVCVYVCMR